MKYILLLLLIWAQVSCQVQEKVDSKSPNYQERLDTLFHNLYQSDDFNGSVLVANSEGVFYNKAFGYADGSKENLLKEDTKFSIGSIYKELPGLSIMMLQEQGKLSVDDKISTHLSNLPKWSEQITIKQLLQYTSGLPKISWGKFKEVNDDVLLKELETLKQLEFVPGEDYLYTNYSPFLLSKIIEKIAGKPYTTFVQENILSPHGLTQSTFKNSFPYKDRIDVAIPFNEDFEEDIIPFTIVSPLFLFVTTAEDLYKLLEALHDFKIVNQSSLLTLTKKTIIKTENIQSPLGTVIIESGKVLKHTHHGSSGNYETLMTRFQEEEITIVLMTNRKKKNLSEITEEIYKNMLRQ